MQPHLPASRRTHLPHLCHLRFWTTSQRTGSPGMGGRTVPPTPMQLGNASTVRPGANGRVLTASTLTARTRVHCPAF